MVDKIYTVETIKGYHTYNHVTMSMNLSNLTMFVLSGFEAIGRFVYLSNDNAAGVASNKRADWNV